MNMKNFFLICLFFLLSTTSRLAQASKEVGNGGDICEDRFKSIRDDIHSWIVNGGPAGLSLPQGLSLAKYGAGMLSQIEDAKISCTDGTISIDGAEKTCMNFVDSHGAHKIRCNTTRFMKETSDSDQYVLVHHEYAGLAGFEVSHGSESNYVISNQISGFLVSVEVKKLAVKATTPSNSIANPAYCSANGLYVSECNSADGKYGFYLRHNDYWDYSFPTGINSINLCDYDGLLKINGKYLSSKDYGISDQISSIDGVSVTAPDKSVKKVNAIIHLYGTADIYGAFSAVPDVDGIEILETDSGSASTAELYLLNKDGTHFQEVDLFCSYIN